MGDDDLRAIAALTLLSSGIGAVGGQAGILSYPAHRDWSHITHTYSEKPLSRRRKRRLRGKAKAK